MSAAFDKAATEGRKLSEGQRLQAGVALTRGEDNMLVTSARFGMMAANAEERNKAAAAEQASIMEAAKNKTQPTRELASADQDLTKIQNDFRMGIIESGKLMDGSANLMLGSVKTFAGVADNFKNGTGEYKAGVAAFGVAVDQLTKNIVPVGAAIGGFAASKLMGSTAAAAAVPGVASTATKVEGGAAKVAMSLGKRYLVPILAVGGAITYALWDNDEPPEVMPMPASAPGAASTAQVNAAAVDLSKLQFPESVNTSIDAGIIKLKSLSDAVRVTTSSFSDLDNVSLNKLNESLDKLNANILKLNEKPTGDKPDGTPLAAKSKDTNTAMLERLDQLNSTMMAMVNHQTDAVGYLSKTAKNTRQSTGNMLG